MPESFPLGEQGDQAGLSQPKAELDSTAIELAAACRSIDELLKDKPEFGSHNGNYKVKSRWTTETLEDGSEVQLAISRSPKHTRIAVMRTFVPDKDNSQRGLKLHVVEADGEIYYSVDEGTGKVNERHFSTDQPDSIQVFREGFSDEDIDQFVNAVELVKQARTAGKR